MNLFAPLLAEVESTEVVNSWVSMDSETRNLLLIIAVFAALVPAVFVWAAFFRKASRKKRHRHHRPSSWEQSSESDKRGRRHRHRRQRSADLPRNPTLAETGGMPPRRPESDDPLPPSA